MFQPMEKDQTDQDEGRYPKVKGRGHFFLVDVPTFAAVCSHGDADMAAAYLILAAGTGSDNRTSTWSREAINLRTALNWRKASECVEKLEAHGHIRWLSAKNTRKTRIDLPPLETRQAMTKKISEVVAHISIGMMPTTPSERACAITARDAGWLAQDDAGNWSIIAERPLVKAYLPNALVGDETGKPTEELTFVERIRKSRDAMAMLLMVQLYARQDLAEQGGVDRFAYSKKGERRQLFTTGQFRILKFEEVKEWVRTEACFSEQVRPSRLRQDGENGAVDFFSRAAILRDAGVLEWAFYLAEDDKDDSILIYPVALERHGKVIWSEPESVVGCYATRAAVALAKNEGSDNDFLHDETDQLMPWQFVLPADRAAKEATLVGVPRLRCRARTTNASRWRKEMIAEAAANIRMFRGIIAAHRPELLAEADRRFVACADFNGDFNVGFNDASTMVQRDINGSSLSGKHGDGAHAPAGGSPPAPSALNDDWDDVFSPFKFSGGSSA